MPPSGLVQASAWSKLRTSSLWRASKEFTGCRWAKQCDTDHCESLFIPFFIAHRKSEAEARLSQWTPRIKKKKKRAVTWKVWQVWIWWVNSKALVVTLAESAERFCGKKVRGKNKTYNQTTTFASACVVVLREHLSYWADIMTDLFPGKCLRWLLCVKRSLFGRCHRRTVQPTHSERRSANFTRSF